MKPTWKTYDIEAWQHGVAGCSPRSFPMPTDRFLWNDCGVCTNPHVLGVAAKTWRIGIFTAQNKKGRWVAGSDVSFLTAGYGRGAMDIDADSFPAEWAARSMELRRAAGWIEKWSNRDFASCPIPAAQAREALILISQAIQDIEPKKVPVYTQLSLFDL